VRGKRTYTICIYANARTHLAIVWARIHIIYTWIHGCTRNRREQSALLESEILRRRSITDLLWKIYRYEYKRKKNRTTRSIFFYHAYPWIQIDVSLFEKWRCISAFSIDCITFDYSSRVEKDYFRANILLSWSVVESPLMQGYNSSYIRY